MDSNVEQEIESKFQNASKMLHTLHHLLEQLETGQDTSVMIQGRIATTINNLSRTLQSMQSLKVHLPVSRRDLWTIKLKKMSEDEQNMRSSMEKFIVEEQSRRAEQEREAQRRQRLSNPVVDSSQYQQQIQAERVRQRLQGDIASVERSNRTANEVTQIAYGVLDTLRQQNETLEAATSKLINVANVLGITKTLLRVIERRQTVDAIIVYSSMVGILVLICILVYFFRW